MIGVRTLGVFLFALAGIQDPPRIEQGEPAPDFAAKNQKDREVKLSDLLKAKKNVLLAFYPKDFTPG